MLSTKTLWVVVVSIMISACFRHVSEGAIEWRYPVLSKSHCPDLSGSYHEGIPVQVTDGCIHSWCSDKLYPIGLYLLMTGGVGKPIVPGASFEELHPLPRSSKVTEETGYVSGVRLLDDFIKVELLDKKGRAYFVGTLPIDAVRIGCTDGFLVIRGLMGHASAESGNPGVSYSEIKMHEIADGSVKAETWSGYRTRNSLTGRVAGDERNLTRRVWIFSPAVTGK